MPRAWQKERRLKPNAARVLPFTSIQSVHVVPESRFPCAFEITVLASEPLLLRASCPIERDECVVHVVVWWCGLVRDSHHWVESSQMGEGHRAGHPAEDSGGGDSAERVAWLRGAWVAVLLPRCNPPCAHPLLTTARASQARKLLPHRRARRLRLTFEDLYGVPINRQQDAARAIQRVAFRTKVVRAGMGVVCASVAVAVAVAQPDPCGCVACCRYLPELCAASCPPGMLSHRHVRGDVVSWLTHPS